MQVGVRFYQIKIYSGHKSFNNDSANPPQDIQKAVRDFVNRYSTKNLVRVASSEDGAEGEKRSHKFLPEKDDFHSIHGLIRYGSFGYGTDVENVATGQLAHKRTTQEADTIPLYYRFWWPPGYSYGLWAFQSYSGKSCATAILSEFRSEYRDNFPDWKCEAKKIVPNEILEYSRSRVKAITLVKRRAFGGTVPQALRPESPDAEVDIYLEVKARGASTFGILGGIKDLLTGQMNVAGVDYGAAYATVMVNGKPKKIGVVGVTTNTGVIDITSSVALDAATMMPTLKSVSDAVKSEMTDFATRLGK